jgi:hypothetical protein
VLVVNTAVSFRDTARNMLLELDKKVNQFERANYAGDKLVNVLQPINLQFLLEEIQVTWRVSEVLQGIVGRVPEGIAQELKPCLLRRCHFPLASHEAAGWTAHPTRRNLVGSTHRRWGSCVPWTLLTAVTFGYIKALARYGPYLRHLCRWTACRSMIKSYVRPSSQNVHASLRGNPTWTPVFLERGFQWACVSAKPRRCAPRHDEGAQNP